MHRIASILLAFAVTACVETPTTKTTLDPAKGKAGTTESEWVAASDLAATLAKAAGGQRLASAIRIREPGPMVRRHLSLAAGGCYHIGVAWVFSSDLQATVSFDPVTGSSPRLGDNRQLAAPGGALDFCSDTAGGATLTFQPVTRADAISPPKMLELAVVYGSAIDPHAHAPHHPHTAATR
jgi:hypothetical protein